MQLAHGDDPGLLFSWLYDVPVGFVAPLFWGWILLILRSPKGGCCSISDDLSCFHTDTIYLHVPRFVASLREITTCKSLCSIRKVMYNSMPPEWNLRHLEISSYLYVNACLWQKRFLTLDITFDLYEKETSYLAFMYLNNETL